MSNITRWIAWAGCCALCAVVTSRAWAQEPPVEPPAPPEPAVPVEPAPVAETERKEPREKWPFALYLAGGYGVADGGELNNSVITRNTIDQTISSWEMPGQQNARASVGWKLPRGKGDFRLDYNGYAEDGWELSSRGQSQKVVESIGESTGEEAIDMVDWWTVEASDGHWLAYRTPRIWNPEVHDTNDNGQAEPSEVAVGAIDRLVELQVPESTNTRLQTIDFLYGREFGGRRYSSRWWAGLRYFDFSGSVVVPAWLGSNDVAIGTAFTDGLLLSPITMHQKSSGGGPTGAWEVDFNFFEKRLALFIQGQVAFVIASLEADSGEFFTLLPSAGDVITPRARLTETRDKSVWQNTLEVGGRWQFRQGLGLEVGYSITGYLDSFLLPNMIILPELPPQAPAGSTALYSTQDYDVEGWHALASFQF